MPLDATGTPDALAEAPAAISRPARCDLSLPAPKPDRNAALVAAYRAGASISQLQARYGLSYGRTRTLLLIHCPGEIRRAGGRPRVHDKNSAANP